MEWLPWAWALTVSALVQVGPLPVLPLLSACLLCKQLQGRVLITGRWPAAHLLRV